jgi:hypothetical protein
LGLLILTVWFRYHDRRIRRRIHASRYAEFVPPSVDLDLLNGTPTFPERTSGGLRLPPRE